VLAVLALFCLALVLAVGVLVRLRRLDRLIWIAPCAALAAAGPLFWQGWHASRAVPATVAELQLLRVSDIADRVAGYGLIASYQPLSPAPPAAEAGGTLAVQDSGAWRPSRRMVWTDLDRWHWPRLRLPPGLQFLSFRQRLTLSEPVQAVGTFTATGFEGRLSGPVPSPADAILAIPRRPCLAVTISDGRLSATRQDVLPRGQYSAGGVLSDEQRRRQGVYQQLLQDSPLETPFLTRPTLLVWTPPLDLHFAHPSQAERRGAALWSIPLTLQRPPAGTRLVVPAPFVSYRTVAGPGGEGASPLLDPRTGQWLDSAIGTRTWLHFQVPAELRPLELQTARLTLQLTAPGRTVDIVPAPRVSPQVPMRRTNPIGRLQFELTGDALPPEPDGGWLLGILVSDLIGADERDQAARWKIDDLQLEIRGRIPGDAP
jgi:hypothetical protein